MAFFTKKFFQFFEELKDNNHKDWFDSNRSTYEQEVKAPFKDFVAHVNNHVRMTNPTFTENVSKLIFRINKDIRFSKDKTPYKTNVAAVFSQTGTKDKRPGFYVHLGHGELFAGGGMYMVDNEQLRQIRQEIFYNPKEFEKIVSADDFQRVYGAIQGEKNKILPDEYKEFVKKQPYIANKQFYVMAKLTEKDVLSDDFDQLLLNCFKACQPLNDFLFTALGEKP